MLMPCWAMRLVVVVVVAMVVKKVSRKRIRMDIGSGRKMGLCVLDMSGRGGAVQGRVRGGEERGGWMS